jgi:plastocyanin
MRRLLVIVCLLLVATSAEAGRGKTKKAKKTGAIRGVITFKGSSAPHAGGGDRSNDTFCAGTTPREYAFDVADHKVGGAYVRIANGTFKDQSTPPADPVVITQSKCEYTPRLVGVMAGQRLEIHNDDPTFHNVRIVGTDGKIVANKAQQKGAPPLTTDALEGTGLVALHCDVHPWMESTVLVSDHPYFAITGASGAFSFTGLAPGKYTIEAWVPTLGWQSGKVKVGKGKKAAKIEIQFDLDDCGGCRVE